METVAQELITDTTGLSNTESNQPMTVKPMVQKALARDAANEYVLRAAWELHQAKTILSTAPRCGGDAKKISRLFEAVDKYLHKADKKIQLAKEESNG